MSLWAVKKPDGKYTTGKIIEWTLDQERGDAIEHWRVNAPEWITWGSWRKRGYRCVRVQVTEIKL